MKFAYVKSFLLSLGLLMAGPSFASDWELDVAPNRLAQGKSVYVALTITPLNSEFSVICDHRGLAVEIVIEGVFEDNIVAMDLGFGVDGERLIRMRGYPELMDDGLNTVLSFYDKRGRPNANTNKVVKQLKRGNTLFVVDPLNDDIIEEISLKGSNKAITAVESACATGVAGKPSDERILDEEPEVKQEI